MAFNWGRDLIQGVAPLAGSVDRNRRLLLDTGAISRRSPRGERG